MQKTKSGFFNTSPLTTVSGRGVGYNSGYFERSEKRSPYSQTTYSVQSTRYQKRGSIGFTVAAVLLLFLVFPVGLIMIWNHRVGLTPGTKLLLTLLAAVAFCLILVYVANVDTQNPQLMKVQAWLNSAFDTVYNAVTSAFQKIGEWLGVNDGGLSQKFTAIWDGIKENFARAGIKLLGDKADNARYVKTELPQKLLSAYKNLVGYEEKQSAAPVQSTRQSNIVANYIPEPTEEPAAVAATALPTPAPTVTVVKVELPSIRSASEAAVYYNAGGTYYHMASTCTGMFSADSHTLAEAARDGKVACQNCSVVSMSMLNHETEDYMWVDSKNVAHTTDLCSEFVGNYRIIPMQDVYEGHYTYCPKCRGDVCFEYMRQNDSSYNVQYENLTQDEIVLYEYEKTIEVYYSTTSRYYHSARECQQMNDDQYTHNLFEALHKDGKKPCPACDAPNEADAREYLEQFKQP